MSEPHASPQVRALLRAARQLPEDEAVRIALADALEEAGDLYRAEFVRLQLPLGPGSQVPDEGGRSRLRERAEELLAHFGGAWLGPLWQHGGCWRRGLLAVELNRRRLPDGLDDMLPWIDCLHLEVTGRDALCWAATLTARSGANHVTLHLRRPFTAEALLGPLGEAPEAPDLRTLTFGWPPRMALRTDERVHVNLPDDFFGWLAELPLARCLSHLGSIFRLTDGQARAVRAAGIEPVRASGPDWPDTLPPADFSNGRTPVMTEVSPQPDPKEETHRCHIW